jgi:hypothetical protein
LFSNADRDGFGRRGRFFDKDGPIRSFFAALSPSLNGHKIDTPILLNLAQSEVVAAGPTLFALREYGRPYEAYVFSDERHMKWQPGHRYNIYRRNSQWLQFWLQDREVSDPVDPQQYDRWRLLRNLPQSEGRAQPAVVGSEKTASQVRPQ